MLLIVIVLGSVVLPPVLAVEKAAPAQSPRWYDDLALDRDRNSIDDAFDSYMNDPAGSVIQRFIDLGYMNPDDLPVFVVYSRPVTDRDEAALRALGGNIRLQHRFLYVDVISASNLTTDQVSAASRLPGVVVVEFQKVFAPVLDVSAKAVKSRPSSMYSPQTAAEYNGGYSGDGITVAVLDTGVDDEHESLDGKFLAGVDFTDSNDDKDGTNNPDDKDGHGTHVASTVMGTGGLQGTYVGVAPDCKLVDLKVLTDWGFGTKLSEGIEWCISNQAKFGIDILSISIGEMMGGDSDGKDTNGRIAQQACDNGMVVVAAIGNDGNEHIGISSPAAADNVVAVGAVDDVNTVDRMDDWVADFSNSGPRRDDGDGNDFDELKPDVTAPGVDIMAANSYNGNLNMMKAGGYKSLSGTSMACPHVAGVCALVLQANSELPPKEIQDILRAAAEPRGDAYDPAYGNYSVLFGWGMVDAYKAVKMATGDYQKVTIVSPSPGSVVHSTVEISGTASNQKGTIIEVNVRVDNGIWNTASGAAYWSYSMDTTEFSNGPHTVYVRSQNDQYEYSEEMPLGLTFNNLRVSITSPTSSDTVGGDVEFTGTCDGTDIQTVEIKIGDGSYRTALNTAYNGDWSSWSYEWDSTQVKNGDHTVTVRAVSGDQSPTASITLDVNNGKGGEGDDDDGGGDSPGFQGAFMLLAMVILALVYTVKGRVNSKHR